MANVLIAVALGLVILAVAIWMIRLLAMPQPPEPTEDDLVEVSVDYRCIVCGLRLTVTQVQGNETTAPKHCREEMVLV
jgi:hypothetical protein